jgi:hypothetical protein
MSVARRDNDGGWYAVFDCRIGGAPLRIISLLRAISGLSEWALLQTLICRQLAKDHAKRIYPDKKGCGHKMLKAR